MDKEQIIERLWENSNHGTQRRDVEAAYAAGALEARIPQAKLDALRAWLASSITEYESGQTMSIAESVHGASVLRQVLSLLEKMDAPNAVAHREAACGRSGGAEC